MIFDLPEIVGRDACVELSFVGHRMSPTRSRVVAHGSHATSSKTPTTVQRCEQAKSPQRPTRPHFRGRNFELPKSVVAKIAKSAAAVPGIVGPMTYRIYDGPYRTKLIAPLVYRNLGVITAVHREPPCPGLDYHVTA